MGGFRGAGPTLKNHKNIGFPSNNGPHPLKNHKVTKLGHHRPTSEAPFKWRFTGGPMLVPLWWYLGCLSPHELRTKQNKTKKLSKLDPLCCQNFLNWRMKIRQKMIFNYI